MEVELAVSARDVMIRESLFAVYIVDEMLNAIVFNDELTVIFEIVVGVTLKRVEESVENKLDVLLTEFVVLETFPDSELIVTFVIVLEVLLRKFEELVYIKVELTLSES